MKNIQLFSQYDLDALFLKKTNEVNDLIEEWPDAYFAAEQIDTHISALKSNQQLVLPELDFLNGRHDLCERIYPVSVYQPGRNNKSKVRVSVLIVHYAFAGQTYLLGCRPPVEVPEPIGEWQADSLSHQISVEYMEYEKYPKKTLAAHQEYAAGLQRCYESLQSEFTTFNNRLDTIIETAISKKRSEMDDMHRLIALLR
ncbi:hypothetical protein [Dyadobacter sp. CY347]|uniref:hypothetical protein n=1 Tax=Dyadobacter sp. CY347 TaxID=2909336 RepID=UPI001F3C8AF0|nr:hypothetical protein [Dyadobacter sp. CY347]MCF2488600.1 hypothetical protein [Dyadobacter sp. CY347]